VKVSEAGTGAPFHAAAAKARETKAIALSGLQENSDDEAEGGESSIQDEAERLAEQCAAAIRKHTLECAAMLRDVVLVVTSTRLVLPFDGPGGSLPASYISAFVSEGIRCRSAMPDILDLSAKIERNGSSSHCPFRLSLVQRSSLTAVSSRMIIARSALLVAKCRLLESHRKISFHKNNNTTAESEDGVTTVSRQGLGTGSLILIEGQPGVGKSHLVSSSLVDVLPGRTLNYHVAASPLPPPSGSKRNCQRAAPLVMVLLQYLSKRHGKNVGTVGDVVGRTALLLAELREMDSEASKEGSSSPFSALSLMSHAHLLNDSFGTQCDAPVSDADDEFMLDDSEENLKVCELIMLHLFKRLSEWEPSMVIIEDAHYLDEATWSLCAAITTGSVGPHPPPLSSSPTIFNPNSLPLAIVFVSRPPEFRGLYQKNAASAAVVKQHSTVISLDGLPPEVMEGVLIRQLGHGVKGLTADLYVLVERCSLGNPRIAIEFLVNLRESGMLAFKRVHSQTASSSSMRESFDMSPGRLSNSSSANEEMGGLSVTAGFSDSYIADLSAYFRGQLSKETGDGARYLASTLATKHNLIPMQACRYLGAVVDRLTSAQSLLLTTAAILVADIHKILGVNASNTTVRTCRAHHLLGKPELDGSASGGCFPAKANYEKLANELLELIGLGILVDLSLENDKTPVPQGATKTQFAMSKLVIGFAFPFHVEYLLGGILVEHIRSVEKQMQKHEDAAARVTRKKMASAVMPTMSVGTDAPLLQGDLKVKKHEITATDSASILRAASRFAFVSKKNNGKGEGDWKHRYLCLDSRKLTIYYTKAAYQKASASIGPPKDAVQVELGSLLTTNFESASGSKDNTVTVEMEPYSTFDNANVFTLTSQSSSKNGKVREGTRTWYIEAESEAKAKEWVYMIRYVVEVAEAENKRAKWLSVVQTPEMSKRARKNITKLKIRFAFLRSFMKMWRYDEWGFARLVVSVEEARGVINPHNLGVPLCYVRMSIVRSDATTQSTDSATPMEQRNRRMSRLSIHHGVTSQEEAMSTQYMTPVAHPPSSSPSWKSLGPRGGCPVFIFDNMDALTANPMKGRRRGNTGTRRKFDENDFIENMESFALKIEVCSAEQLVANEVLATALVPLGDADTLDISDESDKSETKIEKIIETTSFRWWKLKTSPGIQSSFLDKSMVAHAAIRVGVKLVYSMPPSIRPSSCSNASNVSQTSHDSADKNVEENEVDVDADPQVATETEIVTPDTTVAEAEEEETQKEEQEVEEPEVDLEMYKKDDDGEGTGFDDLYVAPGASEVLSADDVPNSPEVDAKKDAARHSALSSGGEDIVSFNNPMFRASSNSN
jgi:DNA-dependent RNA polymerase auxiliary subunit epsilon